VAAAARIRSVTGWDAADRRRLLQLSLGVVWLVDAALQFQPYMFTRSFVTQVLEPSAQGVPGVLGSSVTSVSHVLLPHIAAWNASFALVQLAIAVGIFCRPTVKFALAASLAWSVMVWWFGEGFGGFFTKTSPLMGLPGAVILYAALAVLLWPPREVGESGRLGRSVAESSPLHPLPARIVWAVLWVSFSVYLLLPANSAPGALHDLVAGMGEGEPGWIQAMDRALATAVGGQGRLASAVMAAACLAFAAVPFFRRDLRIVLSLALAFSLLVWVLEDFGGVFTGSGTDVNTGPLLVLLTLTYWRGRLAVEPSTGLRPALPTVAGHAGRRQSAPPTNG
jgi:hypothetical protein